MQYNLPQNKEEFVERYKINEKIYMSENNQYGIKSYSGLNNLKFELNNSINNYLDNSNIYLPNNWETELKMQIENFGKRICYDEQIIKNGNFSPKAVMHEEKYIIDEINGEQVRTDIAGSSGPIYSDEEESINNFINRYGQLFFNYLGTEEKLLLCKMQKKYGLQDNNTNFLSEIQFNSELLKSLSNYTKKMFKKDIYLDRYSWGERILFRVGENFDFIRKATRDNSEVEYRLKNYKILDDEGDGIRNFVTSYLSLNMNDKNILLLDEPESFLHPPLANQLGEIIGQAASDNKQIFISTHSVNLLKGIINSCDNINIIRITREKNINFINQICEDEIKDILNNPLLSSSNVLNGLFCEKVYICEAESDEEFYKVLHDKIKPLDSCLFVHGKNKQTLKDIANVYNKLKIANFRIYDFDILKDEDFNRALHNFIPTHEKDKYIELRKSINDLILNKELYNSQGIRAVSNKKLQDKLDLMLNEIKKNGIIILKNGCMETNLEDLGISYTQHKSKWFCDAISFINKNDFKLINNSYIYKWIFT